MGESITSPRGSLRRTLSVGKLFEHFPFHRDKEKHLSRTLAEIPSEQLRTSGELPSSLWDDVSRFRSSSITSPRDLDDESVDHLLLEKLHKRAGIPRTGESEKLISNYTREQKVTPCSCI